MSAWQMWKNLEKCRPIIKRMKPSNEPSLVDFSKPPPFISLARILKLQSFRNSQKKIEKKKNWIEKKTSFPFPNCKLAEKKCEKSSGGPSKAPSAGPGSYQRQGPHGRPKSRPRPGFCSQFSWFIKPYPLVI
jgi:hypothetical protein